MTGNNELCKNCFIKTYTKLLDKHADDPKIRDTFFQFFDAYYPKHSHLTTPEIQRDLNKRFSELVNIEDLYEQEKIDSNLHAMSLYDIWKAKLNQVEDVFTTTLKLAIAGNIIDYGANNDFNINETIDEVMASDFAIDHSLILKNKLKSAQKILYLGDNAGEIVFDKLFIETNMQDKDVAFAVKGGPILNDVTIVDAVQTGMDKTARIISNGDDAPSTILSRCSDEFLSEFQSADLIISKGQGNLEGLFRLNDKRIFFLLMVKCSVIADILKVKKGEYVIVNQQE